MPAFSRPRVRWATAAAAVLLLVGAVAALGGFADVPRERLPTYSVGERFSGGGYDIRVRSITVLDRDPFKGYELSTPLLGVTADLLLRGDAPARNAQTWLRPLDAGVDGARVTMRTVRDGAMDPPVQPGLPVRILYTWPITGSISKAPIRIGVYERYEADDLPIEGVLTRPVLVGVYRSDG